jgi:PAS domain-containing protein
MKPGVDSFSIGEVSSMLGLSAHTIRAWERRYGVVTPGRTASRQRRYRLADVETLKRVKDLTSSRGLSLRLAVAGALGEMPEVETAAIPDGTPATPESSIDGGPWRAVADLDPRVIVIIDGGGRVVDCNVAFARLAGLLRFEMRGRRFADFVDAYDRAKAVSIFRGTPQRRLGWELNLVTPAAAGLYGFDCLPFRYGDGWLIACSAGEVSRTV